MWCTKHYFINTFIGHVSLNQFIVLGFTTLKLLNIHWKLEFIEKYYLKGFLTQGDSKNYSTKLKIMLKARRNLMHTKFSFMQYTFWINDDIQTYFHVSSLSMQCKCSLTTSYVLQGLISCQSLITNAHGATNS